MGIGEEVKLLEAHGRDPVSVGDHMCESSNPMTTFWQSDSSPSIDYESLNGPLNWPSLKPLNHCMQSAEASLMRLCHEGDLWKRGASVWQCQLLPLGVIFTDTSQPELGHDFIR